MGYIIIYDSIKKKENDMKTKHILSLILLIGISVFSCTSNTDTLEDETCQLSAEEYSTLITRGMSTVGDIGVIHNECMDSAFANAITSSNIQDFVWGFMLRRNITDNSTSNRQIYNRIYALVDSVHNNTEIDSIGSIGFNQKWRGYIDEVTEIVCDSDVSISRVKSDIKSLVRRISRDATLTTIEQAAITSSLSIAASSYEYNVSNSDIDDGGISGFSFRSLFDGVLRDLRGAAITVFVNVETGSYDATLILGGPEAVGARIAVDALFGGVVGSLL